MRRRVPTGLPLTAFTVTLVIIGLYVSASATACPVETENTRNSEPHATELPDCRAYEQVSPTDKNATDADGRPGHVQSSSSGTSVTYYSVVPFSGILGSSEFPSYLSTLEDGNWATQGLLPLTEPDAEAQVIALTDENTETVINVTREEGLLLAAGAKRDEGNLYLYNNISKEYKLIAAGLFDVIFAGATSNGVDILFSGIMEKERELAGLTDPEKVPYLFEWDRETEEVSFVGVVKEGEVPVGGAVAGSYEHEGENTYDQNTISEEGSRIFFSEEGGERRIFMREPIAKKTIEVSAGEAQWRGATSDGARAFYTEGGNLYEFDASGDASSPITQGDTGVLGLVGISAEGSYAYFVAEGVVPSENEDNASIGSPNLYEWHEGYIRFITTLNSFFDESDWRGFYTNEEGASAEGYKASRVSVDGTKLLISSRNRLTNYENAGHNELYLYSATEPVSATNPRCVSCNPEAGGATEDTFLAEDVIGSSPTALDSATTRNLSASGNRVFFQTEEAFLPETNGHTNVYEWEQEGTGSCANGERSQSGGCVYLISTGQSTTPSYFGDASADGSSIFFFTRQSLVAQDQDNNVDVYDAREDGGLASQNVRPASPCSSEACRGIPGPATVLGTPSSASLSGVGNVAPTVEVKSPSRAEMLAEALKACKQKQNRKRRSLCRVKAQKRYGKTKRIDRRAK
jgi:hypothetical protein